MRDMAIKLFVLALTVSTATAQVIAPGGDLTDAPALLATDGGTFQNPPMALLTAAGYSLASPAQIAADATAKAEAAAAAAAAAMPSPQITVPIISNGVAVGTASVIVDYDTMEVYATPDTMSPKHPKDEQLGKFATKKAAKKAAINAKNFNTFIAAYSNSVTIK